MGKPKAEQINRGGQKTKEKFKQLGKKTEEETTSQIQIGNEG